MTTRKLVRDRIVDNADDNPNWYRVDGSDLLEALADKLVEEAKEFREDPGDVEELADVMQVVDDISLEFGIPMHEIKSAKRSKKQERGVFREGIILVQDD